MPKNSLSEFYSSKTDFYDINLDFTTQRKTLDNLLVFKRILPPLKLIFSKEGDFRRPRTTDDELDELMTVADHKAAQKAASEFQSMLQQMVNFQEVVFL